MKNNTKLFLTACVAAVQLVASAEALAVGDGLPFVVNEAVVPGAINNVTGTTDSFDLTYHACTDITGPLFDWKTFSEHGYFWVSSYQNADEVVDSQINYFMANGYHIYGRYTYNADQVPPAPQFTPSGDRLNYQVTSAAIQLFVDPMQDTVLGIANCQNVISNNSDDILLGASNTLIQGEKSETNGLSNGDFKIVFDNWVWGPAAAMINPAGNLSLEDLKMLVFDGNITQLGGLLRIDHNPEGSGNLFWLDEFMSNDLIGPND